MAEQTVGVNTDFNVQNLNLQSVIKYFTTVTACNTGNLCVVQDGVYEHDIEYQSTRNYLTAKWFGFVDSQSEINHYVIRAGTSRGSGDLYPPTSLTSFDMVLLTDLPNQLPLNHRIYITIRAYNKAGLYSESISSGFIVDISAPVIIKKPSLSGLDFPDGGLYYIKLIVCNGARICTESESDSIMVDTTPPTSGMFAVSTYHAANLQRHTLGSMSWLLKRFHHSGKMTSILSYPALYTLSYGKMFFMAKVGSVQKFNLYISTFKRGADLHRVNIDIDSSLDAVNISRLTMSPGIVYYSNVVAYTFSGLQTVVSSDGIMVDSSSPISGIVYDGLGLHDIKYQNKSDIASASWHGFTDTESGVIKYTWCAGTNRNDGNCDIVPWKNIGMHTSVSTSLQNHINNGQIIYHKSIATDRVGHTTDITPSYGVTIDTTPPVPILFSHVADNFITNPSFEETNGCFKDINDISVYNLCDNDNCYQPLSWSKVGCLAAIKSDVDTAFDGRSFIYLKGSIQQNVQQISSGILYKLSFVTSHPPITRAVISNIEGSVQFGHKEYVFHIFTKENQSDMVWHLHTFYFRPNANSSEVIISNLDRNIGFLVDNVKIQAVEVQSNSASETPVQVHTVGLHRWSSIHASRNFVDFESPISEYIWAFGNARGNAEIQHFQSVGVNDFGYNYNITLAHSSQVHVTVVAINAAGLQAKAYSAGVDIDNTPPVINQVHDGVGEDIDGQTSNIISANWGVIDPESNINYCEWSIGHQPYGNELQPFTKTTDVKSASISFDEYIISQKTVYTTVRCHNNAGLFSTATSDGVTISDIPPSSDHAVVTIIPQSLNEYSPGGYYQQDKTSVRIKWS
ncbi:unnamed protein product [Mytilus coruscus]|uniref:Uncharacterized protein n=1 Tax=Mytilus coruscus TaxID=42192 RepID=A0A6J8AXJ3_MYTCO|nr:unnamed protein product [Mytilus coruscus]CAC5375031.1 unnamed protein product [Mytilus coruscus]